jgi:hypothetical protein
MKKLLLIIMVVALVAAFVVPALAQPRDRRHHEELNVAWALDLELQINGIFSEYEGGYRARLTDEIERSFNGFKGIAQTNQSAGFGNNQANAAAIAVTQANNRKEESEGLAFATSVVLQGQLGQDIETGYRARYTDEIERSFNGFDGLAQTNQASGIGNNQKNSAVIAANVNTDGVLAASDALLAQASVFNDVDIAGRTVCTASIERSFNGGSGLAQTNQSPGSANNQANQVAVSYAGFETGHRR